MGISTDPTKSGVVAELGVIKYRAMIQLANASTDEALITATSALQQIANKVNRDEADYVVETYTNGSNWYRVYKSGWVEQGGKGSSIPNGGTITFLKPFKDTNYIPLVVKQSTQNGGRDGSRPVISCNASSDNSMTVYNVWTNSDASYEITVYWEAKGYGK